MSVAEAVSHSRRNLWYSYHIPAEPHWRSETGNRKHKVMVYLVGPA